MSDLTPVTDEGLEADRRKGVHRRSEITDNAVTFLIILGMWVAGICASMFLIYCAIIYSWALIHPDYLTDAVKGEIESMFTHVLAAAGGYVASIVKRNTSAAAR